MIKRNGSTFRTLLIAIVMVLLIYFIYLYNDIQSNLRNSEIMSEKLKRDRESLTSQLQDISLEKENVKERFQKEKLEIMSRLTDIQSKYKMLQSQHQDMETEYSKIQQKLDKFSEDSKQKDANRNQEFMQLKQEKEMEIVKLKDQNANMYRENEQYKAEIINLKQQLQQQQKNINNQMDTGGGVGNLQFVQRNLQQPMQQQQQQQLLQQQPLLQQQQQQPLQQQQQQPQGLFNNPQNGNPMNRILHQPVNNQFGQQAAQMPHAGNLPSIKRDLHNGLPAKHDSPLGQQHFQIQPAELNPVGNAKADSGKDLVLQKEEAEKRKHQHENEFNQVEPPINNEKFENTPNKTGAGKPTHPVEAPNVHNPPVANPQQNVLIAPAANEKVNGPMAQDEKKNILEPHNKDAVAQPELPDKNEKQKDVLNLPAEDNEKMRVHL